MAGTQKYEASKRAWDNLEKMDIIKCQGPEDTPYWTKYALHLQPKPDGSLRLCGDNCTPTQ
jgi:hypothetical protein